MKMPESIKNGLEKSKKVIRNGAIALALAGALSSCDGNYQEMSFNKEDLSGEFTVKFEGKYNKVYNIKVEKLEDGSFHGVIDESIFNIHGYYEEYSGDLDEVIGSIIDDLENHVWNASLNSKASGERLQSRTFDKVNYFAKEYKKFLNDPNKGDTSFNYIPPVEKQE